MKKWEIQNKFKVQSEKFKVNELINILLENRGIKTKKEIDGFLHPKLEDVTIQSVGIDKKQLEKALKRIQKAIDSKEHIIIYGDYDVDGICGCAVLWETLYGLGANVLPYIPHRVDEGYGLSIKGIQHVILNLVQDPKKMLKQVQHDKIGLIITVDNGIVANEAVGYANRQGIDVIITDHHVPSKKLPNAYAIVHTTRLCGTGVAYLLAQSIRSVIPNSFRDLKINEKKILKPFGLAQGGQVQDDKKESDHLALVALATIADLVPLTGANRTLTKFGLEKLRETSRPGIIALCSDAGINQKEIGVYEVGHMISPRLNAMGRLESAMDSLRLLCTKDRMKAQVLADTLGLTNRERQQITLTATQHASSTVRGQKIEEVKLLFVSHETYQQGVIGLVAGKLVEEFYRPSIVVSVGDKYSKASARSVHGFNIIEFIRQASEYLVDAGGHPMAAGFTVETEKLPLLQKTLEELAHIHVNAEMLLRTVRIDCEIPLALINEQLYSSLQKLAPFGMGNQEPTFVSKGVTIDDIRTVGKDKKHLKLTFSNRRGLSKKPLTPTLSQMERGKEGYIFDGIAFGMGERAHEFHVGNSTDIVYTIDKNTWNGQENLQLKIKDIKASN